MIGTREDWYGRVWPEGTELCGVCGQPDNCGECTHGRLSWDQARDLGALVGTERFTWHGWEEGTDVYPEEPGKEWLTILDDGEEYAVIVLRTDADIFRNKPGQLTAARAAREIRANAIVRALNEMVERGDCP